MTRNLTESQPSVRWQVRILAACLLIGLVPGAPKAAESPVVSRGSLEVRFDDATRTFAVSDSEAGVVLGGGVVRGRIAGREFASDDKSRKYRTEIRRDIRCGFSIVFDDACTVTLGLVSDTELVARVDGPMEGRVTWESMAFPQIIELFVGRDDTDTGIPVAAGRIKGNIPLLGILQDEQASDKGVLVTTLGPAAVPGASALFDPEKDLAMTIGEAGRPAWDRQKGWQIWATAPANGPVFSLKLHRHYYRDTLGIAQYAPIKKRKKWPTAPVVAMTWYGIEGWKGKPAQTKEWLYPNIDWVAKHLLPYAETLVFQLDDNYYTDNDPYMRDISDYIRSRGLVPGIWFTPYTVAPKEVHEEHPDWFIHGEDGKPLGSFGGVSYRDHYTLNVTKAEAVDKWFAMWWRKASETWNFDFFKIDGQPQVIDRYKKSVDGGGVDGYRKGLEIARKIVGEEKFINGCWGIPLGAIGGVDGSRTGGDTGNHPHAIDMILRWNFLNNIAWWSDPDAAANLYKATVERARLNAQARVLTGQQFLTDDVWTSVPPEIARVWQLSYPMLDIKPVNLYRIGDDWKKYDLFDLRIAKPWGTYDVVGLFNYEGISAERQLDLGRLPLEASEVHVYEYWEQRYLGRFLSDAKIPVYMEPYEGKAYSIVPSIDGQPQLISTSRHVTQGGLDLDTLGLEKTEAGYRIHGKSSHLVNADPCELVFAAGRYVAGGARADGARKASVLQHGSLARVRIEPAEIGTVNWDVWFAPRKGAALDIVPAALELGPESSRKVEVASIGSEDIGWQVRRADPRVKVLPPGGKLNAWPDRASFTVSVDSEGLEPGTTWEGSIEIDTGGGRPLVRLPVKYHVPPPVNLALKAKASASSQWNLNYKADRANDGVYSTRWNPREGDKDGCWLELKWEEMVEFDRVVIDECMDFGPRIQAWRLMAGRGDKGVDLARGEGVGRKHAIDLDRPMKAEWLRLVVEKASVVPTIWELEVYRMKKDQ